MTQAQLRAARKACLDRSEAISKKLNSMAGTNEFYPAYYAVEIFLGLHDIINAALKVEEPVDHG